MNKKRQINKVFIIKSVLFLAITAFIMISSISGLSKEYIEDAWIQTKGVVLDPKLQLKGKENVKRATQGIEQTVNYEYKVNGTTYRSNSFSRDNFTDPKMYPEGKIVDVYYNPNDESQAVLSRSLIQKQFLYVVIGFSLLIMGVIFHHFKKYFYLK